MAVERDVDPAGPDERLPAVRVSLRIFISYARDDAAHENLVRDFWMFLRSVGVDARLSLPSAEYPQDYPQDYPQWLTEQIRAADRILVVASPQYRRHAEGDAAPDKGGEVQWEARLIREVLYADQQSGPGRVLPVVLPGGSTDDLPLWLAPSIVTVFRVSEFTVAGAESLLRVLTRQPYEVEPSLGHVPVLAPLGRKEPTQDTAGWDFFVSYAQADQAWAEWVAWQLEEDGYRVLVQAWDTVPGSNWILNMHEGVQRAARTVAILSPTYLSSVYATAEWQAAWERDPGGEEYYMAWVESARR